MKRIQFISFLLGLAGFTSAQVIDQYVEEGLENNLALRQKEINYQKSLEVLTQARAMFYPDISLNARYTWAEGGRIIEFPVGNLLNPVYQTLNDLLGMPAFSDLENQEFEFYRPREHETRIRLMQPVIDSRLFYNVKINKQMSLAIRAERDAYTRQLVAEIKTAYWNYMKSTRMIELLDQTKVLLEENIRVNESLFRNHKVTRDNVFRSRAELSRFEQEYAEMMKNHHVSRAWFNFLLNRHPDTPIIPDSTADYVSPSYNLEELVSRAMEAREDLNMIMYYKEAADQTLSLNRSIQLPSLYASVDYGFQGTKYEFTGEQDYVLASLVLRWNVFHGFDTRSKISQARIQRDLMQARLEETGNQVRLQVIDAYYAMLAARESIEAAREELYSARQAFRVVERKFAEGQASLIQFIDARTTLTRAGQRLIISRYDYQIRIAELERVACLNGPD